MTEEEKTTLENNVVFEAMNLRSNATLTELGKLDFNKLIPYTSIECIYGQMTGDCFSIRATELISYSANSFYHVHGPDFDSCVISDIKKIQKEKRYGRAVFTAIEIFIGCFGNNKNGNNKILIDYLKGKTDKLVFNPW